MSATRPPLAYLVTCSQMSLESVELSRLNQAANLRKEFHEILEEWIDSEVDARLARLILEWKRSEHSCTEPRAPELPNSAQVGQLAMAFLPEPASPAEHAQPSAPLRNSDRANSPSCSQQLAKAAEMKHREIETLAERLPRQSRTPRRTASTRGGEDLARRVPAARARSAETRVAVPIRGAGAGGIEFVPLHAVGAVLDASREISGGSDSSEPGHILCAKLG